MGVVIVCCTEPTTEATTEATVETTAETTALNALGVDMAVAVEEERAVNPTLLAAALVAQVKGIAAGGGGWILKGWPVTEEQVSDGREGKGRRHTCWYCSWRDKDRGHCEGRRLRSFLLWWGCSY